jgi:branched-chain amino acid transport system permease protein
MQTIALFVLLGLGPGALIAGVGLGVVMVYRASGLINFATGVVAAWAAFVFYGLRTSGNLLLPPLPFSPAHIHLGAPWATVPAFVVALAYCAVLGVVMELGVVRPLRRSSTLAKLLASLGVFLFLQAVLILRFGTAGQTAPSVLSESPVQIFGVPVPEDRFLLLGIVLVLTAALTIAYRYSRFGLATRAGAEDESNAALYGLAPHRVSMVNLVIAYVIVGALGILIAPLVTLDPNTIPDLVIPALAAALLARFTSFGIVAGVGILMGVVQSLLTYLQSLTWFPTIQGVPLPGLSDLVFFLMVVIAMLWQGSKLPVRGALVERRLPAAPAPRRLARPALIGSAVLVLAFLVLPYEWRQAGINSLIGVIVCLSLVVIIGFVGQVSLLQLGLAGVSGFAVSKLAVDAGLGFPIAPLIAVIIATGVGVLVSFAAVRVRGVNLAIVTLAAAVALENFGLNNPKWGAGVNGSPVPSPHLFGLDMGINASFPVNNAAQPSPVFGLVCAVAVVAACLLVGGIRRSRLGHRMLAVRSNERAAAAAGISVTRVKLTAFALSSVLAGVAGTLYAYNFRSVSADEFGFSQALTVLAFAYIGGITTIQGSVVASVGVTGGIGALISTQYLHISSEYQFLLGGLLLVVILVAKPEGLASNRGLAPPPVLLYRGVKRLWQETVGRIRLAQPRES